MASPSSGDACPRSLKLGMVQAASIMKTLRIDECGNSPPGSRRPGSVIRHPYRPHVLLFRFEKGSTPVKVYESKDIRNVGVVGHGDSGNDDEMLMVHRLTHDCYVSESACR
jgi:hypothetical protein